MRSILAVITAIAIFLFSWALLAGLLYVLGWAALNTGQRPGLFFFIHIFLMWVLSPGVGAAVAVYAASSAFQSVPPATIFVSFISVWTVVLLLLLLFGVLSWSKGTTSGGQVVLFLFQAAAILAGARVGRVFTTDPPSA
jgi:hypothetical protein